LFVDSSGRLLVGTSSAPQSYDGASLTGLQIEKSGSTATRSLALISNAISNFPASLHFGRSRGTTNGAVSAVINGDDLGVITFGGADGTTAFIAAANIIAEVDGTPGTNDMPGRLVFSTTADGAASPTERMRISNAGTTTLTSAASTAPFIANIGASEAARIDSSGRLLVGTSSTTEGASIVLAGNQGLTTTPARLYLCRTAATPNSGDDLGDVVFAASNQVPAAVIRSSRDGGTWTAGSSQPSRLVFSTTADGASSPTERLRIDSAGQIEAGSLGTAAAPVWSFLADTNTGIYSPGADQVAISTNGTGRLFINSSGNVGIGAATASARLQVGVQGGTVGSPSNNDIIIAGGAYNETNSAGLVLTGGQGNNNTVNSWAIRSIATGTDSSAKNELTFSTGSYNGSTYVTSEKLRIDSSGRLLVGTSSARSQQGVTPRLQVEGLSYEGISLIANSNAVGNCPVLLMGKSRGTSLNSSTIVQNNDRLASIFVQGADGTDIESSAAAIEVYVDGTPGANDMPGRIVFSTTADGASSPTERMRITSTGQVRLAGAGITFNGDTAAANELDDYEEGTWTPALTGPTSQTYSSAGYYVKIGNTVTIQGFLNFTVAPTGGTNYRIALPFASTTNKDNVRNGLSLGLKAAVSGAVFAAVFENTANLYFYDGSANALTLQANWSTGRVNFFGTYTTT
jgi:hypothetical protein